MSEEPSPKRLKLTNATHRTVTTRRSHLRRVINGVPDEIWLQILGHLSTVDISRLGATCTRLFILAQDLSLWEKLQFDVSQLSSNLRAVESVIDKAANVKEMRFTNVRNKQFDSMAVASLIVRARRTLKVLTLSRGIRLGNVAVARFGCLVNLEKLNLVLVRISLTGVNAIANLKNLREFKIKITHSLPDSFLNYLFKKLKNLVIVNLYNIDISKETFRTLAQNNPSLETVILPHCFEREGASQQPSLADLTKNCPDLRLLNLSGWEGIDDDDINALGQTKKLLHLDLSWCDSMTDDMLLNISKNCPELRYLGLRGLIVKFDFVKAVAQNCPHLQTLEISGCKTGHIIDNEEFMYQHVEIVID